MGTNEERRRGLTVEEQLDMRDKVNKLYTVLIGNGVKGRIQMFEEDNEELKAADKELNKRVDILSRKFWVAVGAIGVITFIAPFVADKIL